MTDLLASMNVVVRCWLIRILGLRECGAFGGLIGPSGQLTQRWCRKPFGHSDSCAYDILPDRPDSQPGSALRAQGRGWTP